MRNLILHISDLHVTLPEDFDGSAKQIKSYLIATEDHDNSFNYIDKFTKFVKETVSIDSDKIYLLITGDLTESGELLEFKYAEIYLNKIITDLKINKDDILLIPGDHDLNRRNIVNILSVNPDADIEKINIAKFENFKTFYNKFFGKIFEPNCIITDNLEIHKKIRLLGVNSSYKIDLKQKEGYISIKKLEKELELLNTKDGIINIFCCHHNILSSHENKKSGQWNIENRARLLSLLLEKSINFIFSGNEHTSCIEKHTYDEITVSDSGSFASNSHDATFKIYDLIDDDDISIRNNIYGRIITGQFENQFYWEPRSNARARQDEFLKIFIKNSPIIEEEITLLVKTETETSLNNLKIEQSILNIEEANFYYNSKFTDSLYNLLKEQKAFHSGHFHWSESSRAHNWVDISKLIENKDNLNFLKEAVVDVIDTKINSQKIDLIIGLGYEGNILATKSTIKYNKPYSFLPYSYRYNEHHTFETILNFENNKCEYKNVLIITDVVNNGKTIRKLIKKRQADFFDRVEKIYVVSLFYTGEARLNNNILNFDFIKTIPNYDLTSDEEVNNIEFYTVKSLRVEKCPYGKNFREECFIYKDELSCVNLFYDETKYQKK